MGSILSRYNDACNHYMFLCEHYGVSYEVSVDGILEIHGKHYKELERRYDIEVTRKNKLKKYCE